MTVGTSANSSTSATRLGPLGTTRPPPNASGAIASMPPSTFHDADTTPSVVRGSTRPLRIMNVAIMNDCSSTNATPSELMEPTPPNSSAAR